MNKTWKRIAMAGILALAFGTPAFAGGWQDDGTGWWYLNDDGTYPTDGWQWIEGGGDGISRRYYFDANGYCLMNTTVPDGSAVDGSGAWVVDGVIQTQAAEVTESAESETPPAKEPVFAENQILSSGTGEVSSHWTGKYPYVEGMVKEKPASGNFYTVNISTGKYHKTSNVEGLLPKNTMYYPGDGGALESSGYSACKKKGCY